MTTIALRLPEWRGALGRAWPGLLLCVIVAIASAFIADTRGGPTLLYALLLGIALNSVVADGAARPGVDFAARRILRLGVALLGARITFDQIGTLGWTNIAMLAAGVVATIAFGVAAARAFRFSCRFGILTGGATAICGASAAIAIATVLPRDENSERELVFTIAGVTALSTVAMVVYPAVAGMLALGPHEAGVFLGGTIHDVAQVVGAGYSISPEVGDYAVLAKMFRVALLLPVVMALTLAVRHRMQTAEGRDRDPLLPPFLLVFVALLVARSFGLLPPPIVAAASEVSRACLVVAIAAVGLKTSPREMKRVGGRAIALLGVEALFLAGLIVAGQMVLG